MLGANVFWGLMAPVVKLVLASGVVVPLLMVDFRVVGAAALFWVASMMVPRQHVPVRDKLLMAGAGMLGILLNQGCYIVGLSFTSPGEASLVTTTIPMWVMILAWLILREPITARKTGGIALGAAGAVILILGNGTAVAGGKSPALGDVIVMMAQLSYALYLTLYRNFIRRYSLVTMMKWMFLSAAVVAVPLTYRSIEATRWEMITGPEWAGIGYVVLCATFLAYIFIMIGQKSLRPTLVGMYNYVQPVVATAAGVYLGLDTFSVCKGVAVIMIFSGVYMVTTSRSKQID